MRILVITDLIPYPLVSGGRIRVYNLLRHLAREHQVWLATLLESPDEAENVSHFQQFCAGVITGMVHRHHPITHLPGLAHYALTGKPLELKFFYSQELINKIQHLTSTVDFDIIQIEQSLMALYSEIIPANNNCKQVLMLHDVIFEQSKRIYQFQTSLSGKLRGWLFSWMMHRWEPFYLERFDRCTTVSENDRRTLLRVNPKLQIDVIPNGVDTKEYQPLPQNDAASQALLFIGDMRYPPGADAATYFAREIFPSINGMVNNVELWIVGREPPPELENLSDEKVHITGRVDDVLPYYERSAVCIVPLRAGGGTRLKILEAMALGRPVVSTTIGCEGLDVVGEEHLLIADSPERFAEQIFRLLTDQTLYHRITAAARQLVVARYDWSMIGDRLLQVYENMREDVCSSS